MSQRIEPGRTTAESGDEVVVFLIGMRISRWRAVRSWLPTAVAMPRMLRELAEHPDLGLLDARSYLSGRVLLTVQYWRSFEALESYARATDRAHLPAWRSFNERARSAGPAVGIFHETYVVAAGSRESVYVGMPPFGLGRALGSVPVQRRSDRAAQRLRTAAMRDDAAPVRATG